MTEQLTRAERLQIMLDAAELQAIDDFRFKRRMPSRAATVRELLRRGLAAEGFELATARTKSQSFGVIDPNKSNNEGGDPAGRTARNQK
jgi:metal-responsive CopG/Arc/MetJ family transcriptional regulator